MRYMEENLDLKLENVLQIMQRRIVRKTSYLGIHTTKSPLDLWIYQEIIFETRPDVIIEIGCGCGGGCLYLANICESIGIGKILGIDISLRKVPEMVFSHPRIKLIEGDACLIVDKVRELVFNCKKILLIEDSSHTYENTLVLLNLYSPLVNPGSYYIVEDSNSHHGVNQGPHPGAYEAIDAFLSGNNDFESDRERESFLITWNPKGYLRRKL